MVKTININGTDYKFKSSFLTPILYRNEFNRDLFVDMNGLIQQNDAETTNTNMLGMVAYIMNKQAEPDCADSFEEWADCFEIFDIIKIMPSIVEMWAFENITTSVSKKKKKK